MGKRRIWWVFHVRRLRLWLESEGEEWNLEFIYEENEESGSEMLDPRPWIFRNLLAKLIWSKD